ncbi:unnamed protein product [Amoebophrya sp. A120]|nr:unnamed protein product [Amoebophrya sp. A120]|eukprot:GSA120T00011361001.1
MRWCLFHLSLLSPDIQKKKIYLEQHYKPHNYLLFCGIICGALSVAMGGVLLFDCPPSISTSDRTKKKMHLFQSLSHMWYPVLRSSMFQKRLQLLEQNYEPVLLQRPQTQKE